MNIQDMLERKAETIAARRCVSCNTHHLEFRDSLSIKEYSLSGLCQDCQDKVFLRCEMCGKQMRDAKELPFGLDSDCGGDCWECVKDSEPCN